MTLLFLIGHEDYYPRFGYEIAAKHNITFSFEVPDINAMVLSLDTRWTQWSKRRGHL